MVDREDIRNELNIVRGEISGLKACQVKYFTFSIAGTAALFGAANAISEFAAGSLPYLAPLVLLLPCWWIFFDKATSITRNAGYATILEEMIRSFPQLPYEFLGFESSLLLFREKEDAGLNPELDDVFPKGRRSLILAMMLRTRHRYWIVNWYTFFPLSALCCYLGYCNSASALHDIPLIIACSYVIYSTVITLVLINRLIDGRASYKYYSACWRKFLK